MDLTPITKAELKAALKELAHNKAPGPDSLPAEGQSLYTILLDWEKAFDKIHPDALLTALTRYGVPPHLTALIKNIYTSPQFTVSAAGCSRQAEHQCPLSPYLFLIVHGTVMHDVDQELTAHSEFFPWLYSQNQPFYDLAYADDTALIAGTAKRAEQLLHTLQKVAAHSNLHLNLKKCVLLRSHTIHFTNGTPLTIEQHAKYLGVTLSSDGSSHRDVLTRVAKARKHFNSLHQFWRYTDLTQKWKLRICNAVFIPLVTYGLESAALTKGDFEAFHSQSLRKILHFKSTYCAEVLNPTARTYTNQEVRALTSQPPLTHYIHQAQLKLFGHILRSHPNNIERNCCFTNSFQYRGGTVGAGLRPGRRRVHWTEQCTKLLWHWLLKASRPPATQPYLPIFLSTSSQDSCRPPILEYTSEVANVQDTPKSTVLHSLLTALSLLRSCY